MSGLRAVGNYFVETWNSMGALGGTRHLAILSGHVNPFKRRLIRHYRRAFDADKWEVVERGPAR
jgi:hypothetical protein